MSELESFPDEYNPTCPKCGLYVPHREYKEGSGKTPERIAFFCDCGYVFITKTKDAE
jgi:hypothetical protein